MHLLSAFAVRGIRCRTLVSPSGPGRPLLLLGLLWAGVWIGAAPSSLQAAEATITAVNLTGGVYVIDSDASNASSFYNRDAIPVSVTVSLTGQAFTEPVTDFRVRFRLFSLATGQEVPLAAESIYSDVVVWPSSFNSTFGTPLPSSVTFTGRPIPATRLDSQTSYRIEAQVERLSTGLRPSFQSLGSAVFSAYRKFFHFTSTVSGDPERNVIALLGGSDPSYAQRFSIDGSATQEGFRVTVPFALRRYDNFSGTAADSNPVTVVWSVKLFRSDNHAEMALAPDATWETPVAIANHVPAGLGTPRTPAEALSLSATIHLRPAVQLDSTRNYYAVVTLAHRELPAPATPVTADTKSTVSARLLHFNGKLSFGDIATKIVAVSNDPAVSAPAPSGGQSSASLSFPAGGGFIVGNSGYTYSGGLVGVTLLLNGDAICASGTVAVTPPSSPDVGVASSVRFIRHNVTLSSAGATAQGLEAILPAGMGIAALPTDRSLNGTITFQAVPLTSNLLPNADPIHTSANPIWAIEESKPVYTRVSSIRWRVASGRFDMPTAAPDAVHYVRRAQVEALVAAPVAAGMRSKKSNEHYYYWVSGVGAELRVRARPLADPARAGDAELTGEFTISAVSRRFETHFPWGASIRATQGAVHVVNDVVVSATSYLSLAGPSAPILVPLSADCVTPACLQSPDRIGQFLAAGNQLKFTPEGGLTAAGTLPVALRLDWGYFQQPSAYAHSVNKNWTEGGFHAAGHFANGSDRVFVSVGSATAAILLPGANTATGALSERPGTAGYYSGKADYAGLNFRLGTYSTPQEGRLPSGTLGQSYLGAKLYGPYPLKVRSKYYVRKSGISGMQDKVQSAPEKVVISGYDFTFLNFGLSFLSNVNHDSRVTGNVYLPGFADAPQGPFGAQIDFERLRFLCNGALDKADVAGGTQNVVADYWAAEIAVSAMSFERDPDQLCDPGKGGLALGVATWMAHVEDTLYGILGIYPHGNLIPPAGQPKLLDSRLVAPSQVSIRGPRRASPNASGYEIYRLTPTGMAYFNMIGSSGNGYLFNPDVLEPGNAQQPNPLQQGFLNLPGLLKVSYFQALEAHLQTESHRPMEALEPGYPGAWGVAPLYLANGTWGGKSFFKDLDHDPDNRGFPGTTASALVNYRTHKDYYTRAKQKWLGGAIEFNYPVQWDDPTRSFRSAVPITEDFVVLNLEHRIAYLSAERADVRFGAQVGLPQLNLANFVINTLDDATGISKTIGEAIGGTIIGALDTGLSRFDEMLSDRLDQHFERILGASLDTATNQIYTHLSNQWTGQGWSPNLNVAQFVSGNGSAVKTSVHLLGPGGGQLTQFGDHLDKAIHAIDQFIGYPSGSGAPLEADANGIVQPALIGNLAGALIKDLASEIDKNLAAVIGTASATVINNLLAPYLESATPTLTAVRATLLDLRHALAGLKAQLNAPDGHFRAELLALHFQAQGEFDAVYNAIEVELSAYLNGFNNLNKFTSASQATVKKKIRQAITDRLYGTAYAAKVQVATKHRVHALNGALRSGLDSSFGQVNGIVRGALSAALTELADEFSGVLGDMGPNMGSAGIVGYALFQGDALRRVRVDGTFQWSVPTEITFGAYLEINQYQSGDDEASCPVEPGEEATEVILGAVDVGCDFLSPDLRVSIETKFSFLTGPDKKLRPINFAGSFEKTAGEISFEAFAITDLAVAVAFGAKENYLSAALGLRFNSYKAKGGIFFGRTCTLQPIQLWDPFVAQALGKPPPPDGTFTGAYVYGELHIPVSEAILGIPASCFFQVTAGMGVGIFYFLEGPTFGARGMLSVGGDALCMLSLNGRVDMVGLKQGSKFKLNGKGTVAVEIGVCPLCIEASKSVSFSTETGGGKAKGKPASVK
jgi:hypothetical protein